MAKRHRPNILVMISHDTGRHVSPYGVETVDTPNFARLAGEAVQFNRAFSTCPHGSPARAALFSGLYPHTVGVMGNVGLEPGWRFPDDQLHAAQIFGSDGYETWLLGLQHETYMPETLGFDRVDTGFSIVHAADHLEQALAERDTSRPFYCQLGCVETHRPWDKYDTPPDDRLGVTVPRHLAGGESTRADLAQLQGMIKRLDNGLGRVLHTVDRNGLTENTIVVVTTDHGLALPHAKGTLFDAGLEVLLFMRYPGIWPAHTCDGLVSHVDILPSLLEAAEIRVPRKLQGMSLVPTLADERRTPRTAVFAEKTFFHFYEPLRMVRTADHKYIRNFEFCRQTETPLDLIHSGAFRDLENCYCGGHATEQLYDLNTDPCEFRNITDNWVHGRLRVGMRDRLAKWMDDTDDPLLDGPISSPYYRRAVDEMFDD